MKINLFNPSSYERLDFITIPLSHILNKFDYDQENISLYDSSENPIVFQIDRIIPDDPTKDLLVIKPNKHLPPGDPDYQTPTDFITIQKDRKKNPSLSNLNIKLYGPKSDPYAFEMSNNIISFKFNLKPLVNDEYHDKYNAKCFSGSSISVTREYKTSSMELLAAFSSHFYGAENHPPFKRGMQIDEVRITNTPWDYKPYTEHRFFDKPYKLLSYTPPLEPIRITATIVSPLFNYTYKDIKINEIRIIKCRLVRVFSIYEYSEYIEEQIFLQGLGHNKNKYDMMFAPKYFSYMEMGHNPQITFNQHVPDWFTISYPDEFPYQGYGFATDVHVAMLNTPAHNYPYAHDAYQTFSWELQPSRAANCIHIFMYGEKNSTFQHRVGHAWYEHILKPLRAVI